MVEKNKVISLSYYLKNAQGEELDRTDTEKPLEYLHGKGELVPGLENALDGMKIGDKKEVTVKPEEGYGEVLADLKMEVERKMFPADQKIAVGMQFMAELGDGRKHPFNVMGINDDKINIDGNHPLAGQILYFSVEIMGIRDAKPEELAHGHSHGDGSAHNH
ncbi:MAG TPA: peptidylprolyl isomerase [Nitrospina sp.]|jgi:FKBP-type peptidyl-prolyl cis-trans isomerase SlyD|nr:peptidylprolyl isomerase [Nitrospinota bacterium]MBV51681.1 peptidylprolyl isomerase [Nitrospinota bacterium]MDP6335500.1 peptidylprolyl isomerase [Nitrospinaceae bacterium]MDP7147942.1 peptidylprolyl isomerase [Nitrospinaceae bacterium]HAX45881.1 peptidylprolyl isomerase [Nitrospina sp.]|tara:strand:- start:5081 stop:5566 length:486 start_codon:yes stop_codon:yes gene_type:complete